MLRPAVLLLALLACQPCLPSADKGWRKRFSGLGRHASSLAHELIQGQLQRNSDFLDEDQDASAHKDSDRTRSVLNRRDDLKRLLHHQRLHHKTMMKKKRLQNRNELCLFKALRKCGNSLISKFSVDPRFDNRCATKEEFLDCMSRMQHGGCHVKHARHGPSRALVEQYQQRLRRLLRSTLGCVIGVDLSTQAAR